MNTGTSSRKGEILKDAFSASAISAVCNSAGASWKMLYIRNIIQAMTKEGTVVIIIYLMCEKSGVPAEEEARTVVSERGDILSPKYAPEIIAPAVHPGEKPWAVPIPMSATPIVAIVVHELPVIRDTRALMIQVAKRKIPGVIICIP